MPSKTGQKRGFRLPREQDMAIEKRSIAQNVQICLENHSSKFQGYISKLKACLPSKTGQKRGFRFPREQDMAIEKRSMAQNVRICLENHIFKF